MNILVGGFPRYLSGLCCPDIQDMAAAQRCQRGVLCSQEGADRHSSAGMGLFLLRGRSRVCVCVCVCVHECVCVHACVYVCMHVFGKN